ncbi:hypothetical protein GW813_05795, partial [bacterium]|nr:hypothetical protein [bacterium]
MPKDFRLSLLVFVAVLAGAVSLISAPGSAQADSWWAQAGWIQSDTGLVRDGDGLWAGVEGRRPLGIGPVDIGYSLAYAQKVGSVILVFSHPLTGFLVGPAEVTLHTLEAAVTPGIGADLGPARATVFGGAAIALKLAETWDTPFGTPAQDYSYEDIDLALVMGVSLAYGPW